MVMDRSTIIEISEMVLHIGKETTGLDYILRGDLSKQKTRLPFGGRVFIFNKISLR